MDSDEKHAFGSTDAGALALHAIARARLADWRIEERAASASDDASDADVEHLAAVIWDVRREVWAPETLRRVLVRLRDVNPDRVAA